MKTEPIEPASPSLDAFGTPFAERFGDIYHPRGGAAAQARHVFLHGNGLPRRWQGRQRFVVLETGFGLGHNFLATWLAWREDTQRCARLVFVSVEKHPLRRGDLLRLHAGLPSETLAGELAANWPPALHGLHRLTFDGGAVQLLLAFGDAQVWLPELVLRADAFYLDGFAPDRNPAMWQPHLIKALARLAAEGATAATWTSARLVRDGLAAAGFVVDRAAGTGGKRDITLACYAPRFTPRHAPSRLSREPAQRHALIVGAGIAGCATAAALADEGWTCELFDRQAGPANEASGNAGGLFHPVVTAQDGAHARWFRAATACAMAEVRWAIGRHGVAGAIDGLLRLDDAAHTTVMQATIDRLGLPPEFVQALDATAASRIAGVSLPKPAWWFPAGGWVDPVGLAAAFLARAGKAATHRFGTEVQAIRSIDGRWQVLAGDGRSLGEAPRLVLANAGDALRLLGSPPWPIESRRGQLSLWPHAPVELRRPVSGHGYALALPDGRLLFGASSQVGETGLEVRASDHAENLGRLERLFGRTLDPGVATLSGRTGLRWSASDRLPLIGAVPDAAPSTDAPIRLDQPRFVPRREGLYVIAALGSRGISSAALGARVLAALIGGAPCPVEASLLDAVDPARFTSRAARRTAG